MSGKLTSIEVDPYQGAGSRITMEQRDLAELCFQCAGAATGPLLADHPDYVFPSDRVSERVAETFFELTEIDPQQIPGYAGLPVQPRREEDLT